RADTFDLGVIEGRVGDTVRPFAGARGLGLQVMVPEGRIPMVSDRRRVGQIVRKVANNAGKFTDAGHVSVAAGPDAQTVRIVVRDTGIGIKPVDLEGLFQLFRQVDTGLTREHDGTGLGLAICRRLATLLGGEISAASEWGQGS